MTNKNTELDELEAQVEQLNRRLDRLEDELVDDDPRRLTRRQALKAGAAGLSGLALGGAAGSSELNPVGSAEASDANNSTSAAAVSGQVGTASAPVDVFAGLVNADEVTLANVPLYTDQVTISDDSVDTSLSLSGYPKLTIISSVSDSSAGEWGTSYDVLDEAWTGSNTTTQSGTLSGTTGPNGSLNVSRDGNMLDIENRMGTELTLTVIRWQIGQ